MTMFLLLAVAESVNSVPRDSITQIGIGGVLAVTIIKLVFDYTKGKKTVNGYQKTATCEQIVKRFDINFNSQDKRFDKIDSQLDEVKTLIIKNGDK